MRMIDPSGADEEGTGWRRARGLPSMSEVHGTIAVASNGTNWRKAAAFFGPGYLVAVGYMDPGNWATSIAGGSQFGYALLFVILLSSIMAMILQALAARLAVASGRDLAQACRDAYPAPVAFVLWIFAEIAIAATDLAEVIGTAIGLNLLFGIPLEIGVVLTALDVFLVLWLQTRGFRFVEALVITLLGVIALSFLLQLVLARPDIAGVISGFAPSTELIHNPDMLYIALGIIGATVMPHNLYLHSGAVQTRAIGKDPQSKREAIRFTTIDSNFALLFALVINASILVLAASAFNAHGQHEVVELDKAYALLHPLLGSTLAPALFAIALLCCGLNSTVTATMAGQIVMEGFINIRLAPWLRRLITRGLAIVPAVIVTLLYGASGTGKLLILSQVILSLQLPFAVVPLVMFTAERSKMGAFVAPRWLTVVAGLTAAIIIVLNMKLIYDVFTG